MNNIIYNNETIIGTIENIEQYFKEEMVEEIQNGLCFEELQENFKNIFDIILTIQENEQDAINNESLFEIKECSMGGFTYNVYKKVE